MQAHSVRTRVRVPPRNACDAGCVRGVLVKAITLDVCRYASLCPECRTGLSASIPTMTTASHSSSTQFTLPTPPPSPSPPQPTPHRHRHPHYSHHQTNHPDIRSSPARLRSGHLPPPTPVQWMRLDELTTAAPASASHHPTSIATTAAAITNGIAPIPTLRSSSGAAGLPSGRCASWSWTSWRR